MAFSQGLVFYRAHSKLGSASALHEGGSGVVLSLLLLPFVVCSSVSAARAAPFPGTVWSAFSDTTATGWRRNSGQTYLRTSKKRPSRITKLVGASFGFPGIGSDVAQLCGALSLFSSFWGSHIVLWTGMSCHSFHRRGLSSPS